MPVMHLVVPVKILTTGEGGAVTTNDKNLAKKISLLRSHGITKNSAEFESEFFDDWSYEQQLLGYNYRMSDLHASIGISQLNRLEKICYLRNKQFNFYKEILSDLPLDLLEIPKETKSPIHLAIIRLKDKDPAFHRKVFSSLREMNIGVQVHYTPVHLHPYFRNMGFSVGDYPEAEFHAKNSITIPLYIGLSNRDQLRVAKSLKSLL